VSTTTRNDPNVAFNFQDNFSVGTIHSTNARAVGRDTADATAKTDVVEVDNKDNDVSVLTTKTTSKVQNEVNVGSWVASGSKLSALPPAPPSPGPPTKGRQILPLLVLLVEAPGGWMANSHHQSPFYISAGGETTQAQGGLSSGQGTSRRRRDQQCASMFRRSKAASRQHQLLSTCM
jgi:hypothetical protein